MSEVLFEGYIVQSTAGRRVAYFLSEEKLVDDDFVPNISYTFSTIKARETKRWRGKRFQVKRLRLGELIV